MPAVATDTHAIIWYLDDEPRLSPNALRAFEDAEATGDPILVPSICLVELTYLIEKGKIPAADRERLMQLLGMPDSPLELVPLDLAVAAALERIPRGAVPDLPDRIIAATALARNVPLVTRDAMIRASAIPTIW